MVKMIKMVKFPEMVGLGVTDGDTLRSSFTSINNMEPSSKDMFNQTQASLGELQASLATRTALSRSNMTMGISR